MESSGGTRGALCHPPGYYAGSGATTRPASTSRPRPKEKAYSAKEKAYLDGVKPQRRHSPHSAYLVEQSVRSQEKAYGKGVSSGGGRAYSGGVGGRARVEAERLLARISALTLLGRAGITAKKVSSSDALSFERSEFRLKDLVARGHLDTCSKVLDQVELLLRAGAGHVDLYVKTALDNLLQDEGEGIDDKTYGEERDDRRRIYTQQARGAQVALSPHSRHVFHSFGSSGANDDGGEGGSFGARRGTGGARGAAPQRSSAVDPAAVATLLSGLRQCVLFGQLDEERFLELKDEIGFEGNIENARKCSLKQP